MIITGNLSGKKSADLDKRFTVARERGFQPNSTSFDHKTALENLVLTASEKSGGLDTGMAILPTGKIRFATEPTLTDVNGIILQGHGMTDSTSGPRSWSGWTGKFGGTSLYGDHVGGNVLVIGNVRNFLLRDLDVFLSPAAGSGNVATIGILYKNFGGSGPGENSLERVAIVYPNSGTWGAGTIGLQMGEASGNLNIDTFRARDTHFKGLERCLLVKHSQGLVWRFHGISIHQCSMFADFEAGGNLYLDQFHWADSMPSNPLTLVRSIATGGQAPTYVVRDGYIDRQSNEQTCIIFDFKNSTGPIIGEVSGVRFRDLAGTFDFTNTGRPYFDLGHRNQVVAIACRLEQQPIVRWNSTTQVTHRSICTVIGSRITNISTISIPRELCTSVGGYNGQLYLENCTADVSVGESAIVNASVGVYPVAGNKETHWDFQGTDANVKTFDGIDGVQAFSGSWVKANFNPSGHWKFNEAIAATSAADATGNGHTLTIDGVMMEDGAPIPWLERSCNFEKSVADTGRDTGIAITPAIDELVIYGFCRPGSFRTPVSNVASRVAMLDFGGGTIFQFLKMQTNGVIPFEDTIQMHCGQAASFAVGRLQKSTWSHFILYVAGSTLKTYIDGRLVNTSSSGWSSIGGTANLWLGGGPSSSYGRGHFALSRVGVIVGQTITDETADKIFRSMTFVRERLGYRPI